MKKTQYPNNKPYPSLSADSPLNQSVLKYLDNWRKEHPEDLVDIEKMQKGSALFQDALAKLDYEACAKIEEEELTKELKLKYIRLAARQGYLDV